MIFKKIIGYIKKSLALSTIVLPGIVNASACETEVSKPTLRPIPPRPLTIEEQLPGIIGNTHINYVPTNLWQEFRTSFLSISADVSDQAKIKKAFNSLQTALFLKATDMFSFSLASRAGVSNFKDNRNDRKAAYNTFSVQVFDTSDEKQELTYVDIRFIEVANEGVFFEEYYRLMTNLDVFTPLSATQTVGIGADATTNSFVVNRYKLQVNKENISQLAPITFSVYSSQKYDILTEMLQQAFMNLIYTITVTGESNLNVLMSTPRYLGRNFLNSRKNEFVQISKNATGVFNYQGPILRTNRNFTHYRMQLSYYDPARFDAGVFVHDDRWIYVETF